MEKRLEKFGRPRLQLDICRMALCELALQASVQLLSDSECASLSSIVGQCHEILDKAHAACSQGPDRHSEDAGLEVAAERTPHGSIIAEGSKDDGNEAAIFVKSATDRLSNRVPGRARASVRKEIPRMPPMMLRQTHPFRLFWDFVMIVLLGYIAIIVPYSMGFAEDLSEQPGFVVIDRFISFFFLADVLLNFRTGFYKKDGCEVLDWKVVGVRYLKSWFMIDLISSLPWSDMVLVGSSLGMNTNALKLLKSSIVLKAIRLLRLGHGIKMLGHSEIGQIVEETFYSSSANARITFIGIFWVGLLICHWMACFSAVSGSGFLDNYAIGGAMPANATARQRYLASLYWAMTTMSTCGYGDITPRSDTERAYTVTAMILGCGYWGFVLGSMASVISNKDLNTRAYWARMDDVKAWTDHHQFPTNLRRRIRRYFHQNISKKAAPDEGAIMNDLSPGLRDEVSKLVITDDVRKNKLFEEVPAGALALLVNILSSSVFVVGEVLAKEGDVGMAMYIIREGSALYKSNQEGNLPGVRERILRHGDSFGEEIVMGYEEKYRYTVTARSEVVADVLHESDFLSLFNNLPSVVKQLEDNYCRICSTDSDDETVQVVPPAPLGRASLMRGTGPLPLGFPDAVFDSLGDLARQVVENKKAMEQVLRLMNQNLDLMKRVADPALMNSNIAFTFV